MAGCRSGGRDTLEPASASGLMRSASSGKALTTDEPVVLSVRNPDLIICRLLIFPGGDTAKKVEHLDLPSVFGSEQHVGLSDFSESSWTSRPRASLDSPVILPEIVHGAICMASKFFSRFTLPASAAEKM